MKLTELLNEEERKENHFMSEVLKKSNEYKAALNEITEATSLSQAKRIAEEVLK